MKRRGLRDLLVVKEMSINVPDADVPALRKAVNAAIKAGQMPPSAREWMKGKEGDPVSAASPIAPTPKASPAKPAADQSLDQAAAAWDALKGSKKSKDKEKPAKKADDFPELPQPPSANVRSLNFDRSLDGDDEYKSPFAWDKIDPTGTADDPTVPDQSTGGQRPLSLGGSQKGPGLASRAAGSIKNIFKGKPADGRKQLDKALKAADRDANRGKQGALSRIFKGRDVTRDHLESRRGRK